MDKKLTNQALWFLLALAFPLVAIAAGLQSCSDDGPAIPSSDSVEKEGQVKNPLMRSPEEAIDIAQRAWEEFYGEEANPASRSGRRCVIDYGRPVEVIRGAKSRGVAGSDTLLYVVNFADDGGFAVIAAPRHADELLAVTSQGHYYPECQPDQEKVPGFELWMENAQAYAASFGLLSDSVKWYPLDTTHNGGFDSFLIKPDYPYGPDHPGIPVNPPITRDTTKNIDPNDPYSNLLQHKEWNDTIYDLKINPQVRYSWGQGGHNTTNLANSNCEGYYFVNNGLCGCAALAIAQICCAYQYPDRLYKIRPGVGQLYSFDWSEISQHKKWKSDNYTYGCYETDCVRTHEMVATLCKIIGDYGEAHYISYNGTGMSLDGILKASKNIFGSSNVSADWMDLKAVSTLRNNEIFIVTGSSQYPGKAAHAWVCDGNRHVIYNHYYATRENSNQQWEIHSCEQGRSDVFHYNWGWNGNKNGWFSSLEPVADIGTKMGYRNLRYLKIIKPQ